MLHLPSAILECLGSTSLHPFVFAGQTAVLGVGRAASGFAWMTLAVDHRVVDARRGCPIPGNASN